MKKQVSRDQRDEKIAKEFLKLMPELPKTFHRVVRKAERFDHRKPTTFITEMKAEFAKCLPSVRQGDVAALRPLWKLLLELPLKSEARKSLDDIYAARFT